MISRYKKDGSGGSSPTTTTGATTTTGGNGGGGSTTMPTPPVEESIASIAGKDSTMQLALGDFLKNGQAEDALQTIGALSATLNEIHVPRVVPLNVGGGMYGTPYGTPYSPSSYPGSATAGSSGAKPPPPISKEKEKEAQAAAKKAAAKAAVQRKEALTLREDLITSISDAEKSAGSSVETWAMTTQALASVTATSSQLSKRAITSASDLLSRTLFNYRRAATQTTRWAPSPKVTPSPPPGGEDVTPSTTPPTGGSPSNETDSVEGFDSVLTPDEALAEGEDVDESTTSVFIDHAGEILSSLLEAGTAAKAEDAAEEAAAEEAAAALPDQTTAKPDGSTADGGQGEGGEDGGSGSAGGVGGGSGGGGGEGAEEGGKDEMAGLVNAIEELSLIMVSGRVPGEDASTVKAKNLALKVERALPQTVKSLKLTPPMLKTQSDVSLNNNLCGDSTRPYHSLFGLTYIYILRPLLYDATILS